MAAGHGVQGDKDQGPREVRTRVLTSGFRLLVDEGYRAFTLATLAQRAAVTEEAIDVVWCLA